MTEPQFSNARTDAEDFERVWNKIFEQVWRHPVNELPKSAHDGDLVRFEDQVWVCGREGWRVLA